MGPISLAYGSGIMFRSGRHAAFRHVSLHVPARFESRIEGRDLGAPAGNRALGDPGLVEGRQSQLPKGRVGACRRAQCSTLDELCQERTDNLISVIGIGTWNNGI